MNEPVRCRLTYDGAQLPEPVLYRLGRGTAVKVAMISETICARRGSMCVSFSGEGADVALALAGLRSAGIVVEIEARP